MGTTDARVDAYIAKSADFAKPILIHLRDVVHAGCPQVEETMKWSFPHFMYKGILCSMAAFKQHCTFGFWKGSLIVTAKNGKATKKSAASKSNGKSRSKADGAKTAAKTEEDAMGQFGRITTMDDLPSRKVLLGYVKEAIRLNDEGIKNPERSKPRVKKELVIPPYFTAALKKNKKATATFDDFTYSHKKEYVEWVTEAKTDETRDRRLATTIEWLAEGKPRHWKYANC